jgi:hypothetical protein
MAEKKKASLESKPIENTRKAAQIKGPSINE